MDPVRAYERRWFTLLVLCISLMVIGLDNTILNVALPSLVRQLHASTSQLQWMVDSYIIVFAGLLLTAGSLGDRFGRKRGLTIGLAVFGLGSLLSSLAGSAVMLIATRGLMGIGAAFIMPSTLSILTNVFTAPAERAKAIGIWAGVSALGIGVGPLVGGILLQHFWWGSVFLVNVPLVIVGLALGRFLIPESRDPSAPRLDPIGAVLSIAGLATLLWGIIEAPSRGWGSPGILAAFGAGAAVMAAFVAWELHSSSPMLNVRFFENPRFTSASMAITLVFFALFGSLFVLTQYLQIVLGYSTLRAGLVLLPQAGVLMVVAPTSNLIVRRIGSKLVVAFGLAVVATSLGLFITLTPNSTMLHVIGITALMSVGMGYVMAPATESIMGSLPRDKAGVGSAVNDTTRQVGGAVGVAVVGSLLSSRYASTMTRFFHGSPAPAGVTRSVGQALKVAQGLPPAAGQALRAASNNAFTSAMHTAVAVGAVMALIGAVEVLLFLPGRAHDDPQRAGAPSVAGDDRDELDQLELVAAGLGGQA
ncbi:MAG TPA: MFS transporter [Acidimicrobiales bacterium]|nr:MFS transporter [Acidimicrobiales bacterium]